MDLDRSEARFAEYVAGLGSVIGHAERTRPLRDYCTGLMLPGERKSVEPMAARTAPARTAAQHQSLLHFVANAAWSDEAVLAKVREIVLPAIEKSGPIEAWIIHDTSFPKQGRHSVGVHHQYCGQLGKQANCQVAVSLSIANHAASLPVAYRLYLPEAWTKDRARRKKAGVPKQMKFKTKLQIALEQIRCACESGLPRGVALMDAAYLRATGPAGNDVNSSIEQVLCYGELDRFVETHHWTAVSAPSTRRAECRLHKTGKKPDGFALRQGRTLFLSFQWVKIAIIVARITMIAKSRLGLILSPELRNHLRPGLIYHLRPERYQVARAIRPSEAIKAPTACIFLPPHELWAG